MHPRVGDGGERREGAVDSHPGVTECSQVRSTWVVGKRDREQLNQQNGGLPVRGDNQHTNSGLQLTEAGLILPGQSYPSPALQWSHCSPHGSACFGLI